MGSRDLQRRQKEIQEPRGGTGPWEAEEASMAENLLEKRQEINQDKGRKEKDQVSRGDSSPKSMDQFSFPRETVHLFRFLLNLNILPLES